MSGFWNGVSKKLVRIATSSGMAASDAITLCLGTSRTDCNPPRPLYSSEFLPLPRHIPHGLQRASASRSWRDLPLPRHIPHGLQHRPCSRWGPGKRALPRHIPHGLQPGAAIGGHGPQRFASAHPARIATVRQRAQPQRANLCLGTSRTDCNVIFPARNRA